MSRFLRAALKRTLLVSVVVFVGASAYFCFRNAVGISQIEVLRSPRPVERLDADGLIIEGRKRLPPGINNLPATSATLGDAVSRGVEIDEATGELYVLIDVAHWCRNDPVRKELKRVHLNDVVAFLSPRSVRAGVLPDAWAALPDRKDFIDRVRLDPADVMMLDDMRCFFERAAARSRAAAVGVVLPATSPAECDRLWKLLRDDHRADVP